MSFQWPPEANWYNSVEIVLLRHGKPALINKKWITSSALSQWIDDYNAASLCHSSAPGEETLEHAIRAQVIVSSSLKRSIDSAKALAPEKLIRSDQLFKEAELPFAKLGAIPLPPTVWLTVYRLLWFCGYSANAESYSETKKRSEIAARELMQLAGSYRQVLFVGHGIFNRLLGKELSRTGWSCQARSGSGYWGVIVYTFNH